MSSYSVKLKVNLKIGSGQVLTKGHEFRGPLKDLPKDIAGMVEEKSRHLEVRELAPVKKEVPKEEVPKEETPKPKSEIQSDNTKPKAEKPKVDVKPRKTVSRRTKKE